MEPEIVAMKDRHIIASSLRETVVRLGHPILEMTTPKQPQRQSTRKRAENLNGPVRRVTFHEDDLGVIVDLGNNA